jgi:hypothetical protein
MSNPTISKRLSDAAARCFYDGLLGTEDLGAFEALVAGGARALGAGVLRACLERFDSDLRLRPPRGWSARGRESRALVTLLGEVSFERTVFCDEHGRRRLLLDELLGIPPRSRLSPCAFLWVASHAAELSYRKTAAEFAALSGARISHVTVMNVVHREGALLRESGAEFSRGGGARVSQDVLFVESDGLWVHLQEARHRKEALPRFLYEQARKTKSFELKIAALYAGKAEVAPGRLERGGLCLTCLDDGADAFWERAWRMLAENYEEGDVERIAVGGDGAGWCGPERVEAMAPAGCAVDHTLDSFHLMQKVARAFPREGSPEREWAVNLAVRGKGGRLSEMCRRVAASMRPGRARDKVEELASYAAANAASIRPPSRELGTMEGTNAHVGAARLKGQGRSWSRRGAESMCLIRCALTTGRPLVAPPARVWFTAAEAAAAEASLPRSSSQVPQAEGAGWEPPHRAGALGKSVEISLSRRR